MKRESSSVPVTRQWALASARVIGSCVGGVMSFRAMVYAYREARLDAAFLDDLEISCALLARELA